MTTAVHRTAPQPMAPGAGAGSPPARSQLPTRQRRPGWTALAVALIGACAALGALLYVRAGAKTPVVVVVAEVPAGHVLARADLSTVAVSGGVTAIAGQNLDSVVGQTAAVHLLPNMLLQRSMISADPGLSGTEAAVGVVVRSGQIPADGLRPGDTVEVVALPAAGAASGTAATARVIVAAARVDAFRADPAQTGGNLITLIVPRSSSTAVAAASGSGRIALIEVSAR